jgi:2-oxoacid:acceptor oxidoreductase delta subunit (pyruvate/2-ketoisovalerate family)
LAAEISAVERLGIDIQTNVTIGNRQSLDDLLGQGYKAIFIATGAHKSMKLGLSGEEKDGIVDALSFLREVNLGSRVGVGDKVAVIGGNNVAVNAARVAIRLGAKYVSIICQQSKIDMPSRDEEVKVAAEEGVHITYLAAPNNILGEGKVAGLECIRMRLGEADKGQVPRLTSVKGSEFVIDADTVIIAVGRTPDLTLINHELDTSPMGTLVVDAGTLATNKPGIFAGGDVTGGRATVARAIGAGMRASISIDRYMRGEQLQVSREKTPIAGFKDLNLAYFQSSPGAQISRLPVADRIKGFAEVEGGFTESVSVKETERCFSCGVCDSCDNCWLVCPDVTISRKNGEYQVNYDYCKGCGICKEECPRGAITMEEEAKWRK